jgi:hypothetical protein
MQQAATTSERKRPKTEVATGAVLNILLKKISIVLAGLLNATTSSSVRAKQQRRHETAGSI